MVGLEMIGMARPYGHIFEATNGGLLLVFTPAQHPLLCAESSPPRGRYEGSPLRHRGSPRACHQKLLAQLSGRVCNGQYLNTQTGGFFHLLLLLKSKYGSWSLSQLSPRKLD
jgi:hypothetical protein